MSEIELVNATAYDTDDIRAIVEAVAKVGSKAHHYRRSNAKVTRVRVKYLGKTQPFSLSTVNKWGQEDRHHWSAAAQGWGDLLAVGDHPRAAVSQAKGRSADPGEIVLSIARKTKMLGEEELRQIAATALTEAPESGVKEVAFALYIQMTGERPIDTGGRYSRDYTTWPSVSGFEAFWETCPRALHLSDGIDPEAKIQYDLSAARNSLGERERGTRDANYYLRQIESELLKAQKKAEEAEMAETSQRERVEGLESKLADLRAEKIRKRTSRQISGTFANEINEEEEA